MLPFGNRFSDNTNGAWVEWYVALAAGTYALSFRGYAYDGSGVLTFSLNGTAINAAPYSASAAIVDTYAAVSDQFFQHEVCDDLTIPTSAVYVLHATVTGKNASSSGFATNVIFVALNRVA